MSDCPCGGFNEECHFCGGSGFGTGDAKPLRAMVQKANPANAAADCPVCGSTFDDLSAHVKAVHYSSAEVTRWAPAPPLHPFPQTRPQESGPCPMCGHSFAQLARHLSGVHHQGQLWQSPQPQTRRTLSYLPCDECAKKVSANLLERHMLAVHPTRKCSHCGKVMHHQQFKAHIWEFHRYTDCPECHRPFETLARADHVRSQHRARTCHYCSIRVALFEYPEHIRLNHGRTSRGVPRATSCPFCGLIAKSLDWLARHLFAEHWRDGCSLCGKPIPAASLRAHLKAEHRRAHTARRVSRVFQGGLPDTNRRRH